MSTFPYYNKLPQNDFPPECLCRVILRESAAPSPAQPPKAHAPKPRPPDDPCLMTVQDEEILKPLKNVLKDQPELHDAVMKALREYYEKHGYH